MKFFQGTRQSCIHTLAITYTSSWELSSSVIRSFGIWDLKHCLNVKTSCLSSDADICFSYNALASLLSIHWMAFHQLYSGYYITSTKYAKQWASYHMRSDYVIHSIYHEIVSGKPYEEYIWTVFIVYIDDVTTVIFYTCTMPITLLPVEAEEVNPASTDSSSATAVGLFLGGVLAGVLGVLLIEGIVCGAWRLRRRKHKWVKWTMFASASVSLNCYLIGLLILLLFTCGIFNVFEGLAY